MTDIQFVLVVVALILALGAEYTHGRRVSLAWSVMVLCVALLLPLVDRL